MSLAICLVIAALACSGTTGLSPSALTRALIPGGTIVVYPGNMQGWVFQRSADNGSACNGCRMVSGPGTPPIGTGSAMLIASAEFPMSAGMTAALRLDEYRGVRLDQITTLQYSGYRTADSLMVLPIPSLSFVADFDLTDQSTGAQGRIVHSGSFTAAYGSWQTWDARAGVWYGTQSTVQVGGQNVANPCMSASPCTWTQLLTAFPNIGVHATSGAVLFEVKATSLSKVVYVDNLVIGVNGVTTTFDFELANRSVVPLTAPDSLPVAVYAAITAPGNLILFGGGAKVVRDVVNLQFFPTATATDRQFAVDLVQGTVIGGSGNGYPEHAYLIRIPYASANGDSVSGPLMRAIKKLRDLPSIEFATIVSLNLVAPDYVRPRDAGGSQRGRPAARALRGVTARTLHRTRRS